MTSGSAPASPFDLSGKTVLVTGASSGIGRSTATLAAQMGARLVLTGRNAGRLDATLQGLAGDGHTSFIADLAELEKISAHVEKLPLLDGLVSCAGADELRPLPLVDAESLRRLTVVNYESAVVLTNQLVKTRKLNDGASLVYVSSIAGMAGTPGHTAYAGSKAALAAASRVFAVELARRRIRSNCVSPGMVKTEFLAATDLGEKFRKEDEKRYPLGYGEPGDVAAAIVFLLAPAAKWMTGSNMVLDGGYLCQ